MSNRARKRRGRRTTLSTRIELLADYSSADAPGDLHGRVLDFVMDLDRDWFAGHPGESEYVRKAVEHEFCIPPGVDHSDHRLDCRSEVDRHAAFVLVTQIAPGSRTRFPMTEDAGAVEMGDPKSANESE